MSPPSGRPGDDPGDRPTAVGAYDGARREDAPRHLAGTNRPAGPTRRAADGGLLDGDAGDRDDEEDASPRRRTSVTRTVLEWAAVIACGVLIALTAQAFFVQAFWIPSPSMAPTLEVGDRVLVNKLSYKTHDVNHGDLVVFERPPGQEGDIKDLIKRVVAVGGDTIEARDGHVYVNGERIDEPYLVDGTPTDNLPHLEVPEGTVFVMGDNRTNSEDSRVFGPIDEDTIVGRAFITVLPVGHIGWL
jgi:signal peptidase I